MNEYLQAAIGDEFLWVAIGFMCAPLVVLLLVVGIDVFLDNIIDAITSLPYNARFRHYLKNYMFEKAFLNFDDYEFDKLVHSSKWEIHVNRFAEYVYSCKQLGNEISNLSYRYIWLAKWLDKKENTKPGQMPTFTEYIKYIKKGGMEWY